MHKVPGNDPPSGNDQKKKKKKAGKTNGKTDWKSLALSAEEEAEGLKQELSLQKEKYSHLKKQFLQLEMVSVDKRAAAKLRCLLHLWSKLHNLMFSCSEDRKNFEALMKSYSHAMKDAVEEASKPL